MTLSFWKVMFSAQEVLDMIDDLVIDNESEHVTLSDFGAVFVRRAEARSRGESEE